MRRRFSKTLFRAHIWLFSCGLPLYDYNEYIFLKQNETKQTTKRKAIVTSEPTFGFQNPLHILLDKGAVIVQEK